MRYCTHEYHQMVNTETRLIIFFAARDEEALYGLKKKDRKLTVAQIMSFQMFKLVLEKAEEPETKLPTSARS